MVLYMNQYHILIEKSQVVCEELCRVLEMDVDLLYNKEKDLYYLYEIKKSFNNLPTKSCNFCVNSVIKSHSSNPLPIIMATSKILTTSMYSCISFVTQLNAPQA